MVGLVHVDSIVCACHLIGVFGSTCMPLNFHFADSLDVFKTFYVNQYADYHSHKCIPELLSLYIVLFGHNILAHPNSSWNFYLADGL